MPGPPTNPDDLCALPDLKSWLNVQTSAEDQILQNLITRASLQFLKWMSRDHIYAQTYTENRDGNDSLVMLLRNRPIVSVQAVTVNNQSIQPAPDQVNAGYVFDDKRIMLRGGSNAFAGWGTFNQGFLYRFFKGFQNVQIVYTAGYNSIDASKTAIGAVVVPGDLQQAAIEGIGFVYKRQREKGIVDSESANGMVTMAYSKKMLPDSVMRTFQQYTRMAVL